MEGEREREGGRGGGGRQNLFTTVTLRLPEMLVFIYRIWSDTYMYMYRYMYNYTCRQPNTFDTYYTPTCTCICI